MALDGYAIGVLGQDGVQRVFSGDTALNAQVPSSCGIEPPQAWVQVMLNYLTIFYGQLVFPNCGITSFLGFFQALQTAYGGGVPLPIDLSGNALPQNEIDAILSACVAGTIGTGVSQTSGEVNLSGPKMAAPSSAGSTDATALRGIGITVLTN